MARAVRMATKRQRNPFLTVHRDLITGIFINISTVPLIAAEPQKLATILISYGRQQNIDGTTALVTNKDKNYRNFPKLPKYHSNKQF